MSDLFSQSRDAERHVRALLKQAQGPAGPPPGGPPPPGGGGPPPGPQPAPWDDPSVPPGLPKIPPAAQKLPMEMPFGDRAQKQREVFDMDPLAVSQGLDILKAKQGVRPVSRLQQGQRLTVPPPLAGVTKHAASKRLARQFVCRDPKKNPPKPDPRAGVTQHESLARAMATKPLDLLDDGGDEVARYMAKKKVQASIEKKAQ